MCGSNVVSDTRVKRLSSCIKKTKLKKMKKRRRRRKGTRERGSRMGCVRQKYRAVAAAVSRGESEPGVDRDAVHYYRRRWSDTNSWVVRQQ